MIRPLILDIILKTWILDDSDDNSDFPTPPDFNYEDDVAILPFSSGTTGLPKGVMLTHKSIVSNIAQCVFPKSMEFIEPATETFQPTTGKILLNNVLYRRPINPPLNLNSHISEKCLESKCQKTGPDVLFSGTCWG